MAWATDHPPVAADVDSCVTCGLCLPVCPTFRLTGDESASPRGRLAAIAAVGEGLAVVDGRFDDVTSFCLQCRACETACPSMVPYGEIIEAARAEAVAQIPTRSSRLRGIIVGRVLAMPWILRLASIAIATLQRVRLLRLLPIVGPSARGLRRIPLPLPSARGGSWGPSAGPQASLFVGCVADPWFSTTHRASIELLVAAGYRVEADRDQTCCGALAAHGGHLDESRRLGARNINALGSAELIVTDVAGCGAHLKGYGSYGVDGAALSQRVRDITEVVWAAIEDGSLPRLPPNGEVVAVQDACHLEHGQGITKEPLLILEAAGYDVVEADPGGLCCGAAGVYQLEYPETSIELGEAKATKLRATGTALVASANAGCEMQLRRSLGGGFAVAHPVEFYWEAWSATRQDGFRSLSPTPRIPKRRIRSAEPPG